MKTVCKKLFSLMLVAVLLISAIPFQASAAYGDIVQVHFRIEGEVYTESTLMPINANLGLTLGYMLPNSTNLTNAYNSRYNDGKVFANKWILLSGARAGIEVTSSTVLSEDMKDSNGNIVLDAKFKYPEVTITLNPNGGKVDPTSVKFQVQETVGSKLPTPTRDGYVFAGWFLDPNDPSTELNSASHITSSATITAKWEAGSLPVVFQGWIPANNDYSEITRVTALTGKSLKASGVSLPIQSSSYTNRPGYSVDKDYPWVDSKGNIFTNESIINEVTYVRPNFKANTYKITYDFNCSELSKEEQEVVFGSKVTLKQPTRTNHVFLGWHVVEDSYKELKTGDTYNYGDITLVAYWAEKGTVELRVYRDDTDGFKTYYYSGAIKNGELDLNNCNIHDYLKGTYEFEGWFDYIRWVDYLRSKDTKGVEVASNTITRLASVKTSTTDSSVTVIYGMVKGYKATTGNNATNNNNSVNTGTPDPSNPKTGDTIMIAVATMTMAAAALVAMYELKKRKMI